MDLTEKIDIYIIYVSEERKQFLEKQFETLDLNLNIVYFKGYTPETSRDYLYKGTSKWRLSSERAQSATRSHMAALKEWYNTSLKQYTLVIEDDVCFLKENFLERLSNIIDVYNDNNDIDYVSIGYLPVFDKNTVPVKRENLGRKNSGDVYWDFLHIGHFIWGCQAQVYEREKVKKITDILFQENANLLESAVETYLKTNRTYQMKYLAWCPDIIFSIIFSQAIVSPPLAIEKPFISSVGQGGYEKKRLADLIIVEQYGILSLKDYYSF